MQASTFEQFFDPERIVEPYAAPEIFAHRVAKIEILPEDCIQCWHVVDLPPRRGALCSSQVVCKMIYPLASFMPSRTFGTLWYMRNGLLPPHFGGGSPGVWRH